MWQTNVKIVLVVFLTLGVFTLVSNIIPQVPSEVPERVEVGPDATPEELVAMGEELYFGAGGCDACHRPDGERAPPLLGVAGINCQERVPDMTCKEYLHQSLVDPGAHITEGYEPIMPDASQFLTPGQVWALVAFLEDQGGEVTVTSDDLAAAVEDEPEEPEPEPAVAVTAPDAILREFGCVSCHVYEGEGEDIGPSVEEIRELDRSPEQLRRMILDPLADTTPGYEAMAGLMPTNFGERLTAGQLETLVRYLRAGE